MIIKTDKLEGLTKGSNNPELFQQLYEFINKVTNTKGKLFKTPSSNMSVIGYYIQPYKTTTYESKYPMISIAPQKNNISVYVMVVVDGEYLATKYSDVFGKSNVGKSCIRIKKMNKQRYEALEKLIHEAVKVINSN